MLARSLYLIGDYQEAETILQERYRRDTANLATNVFLGLVFARTGRPDLARTAAERLSSLDQPYLMGYIPYHQGLIYAALGDREQAVARLTAAAAQGYPFSFFNYANEPDLLPLSGYEPFESLVRPRRN